MESVTCTGPVNIAVVKYWGKRDEQLILPVNSSLSVTLDQAELRAKTTVAASPEFTDDRIWLNGNEENIQTERLQNVLKEIRRRALKRKKDDEGDQMALMDWHIHICSENNFPTAAGLASSAAGFACLVFSLAQLYDVEGDLSEIARRGSGSACRSMYGGFVAWDMGSQSDGTDSIARQIAPETHWSDLSVLILVVSGKQKHIGSSAGMQISVRTSDLLKHRMTCVVERRMKELSQAILDKDYDLFAEHTMKDSNQLHAVCLDTYPPISYMTDISRDIVRIIHAINSHYGQTKVCYTFDAGPNACLYLPQSSVAMVCGVMTHFFPPESVENHFLRGVPVEQYQPEPELINSIPVEPSHGGIQYMISTKAGPGPRVLPESESLLDAYGLPKSNQS